MSEILVVREFDRFSSILIERGFAVINFPTIKIENVKDFSLFDEVLSEIENYDGVFITSPRAAEVFLARCGNETLVKKFYVLGKRANNLLASAGFETFFDEDVRSAKELINKIPRVEIENKNFLFLRGDRSLRAIPEMLQEVAIIREVVVYKTVTADSDEQTIIEISEKFAAGKIAAVCFFSPSGVEEFLEKFGDFSEGKAKIAAIGQTTADFIEERNLQVDFIAAKPSAKTFADGLAEFLRND